jgi:sugar phosphate isomerase/epimerase
MKLGVYTASLHDKTLDESLEIISGLGLTSIEVNTGGFIGAPHIHVDALLSSAKGQLEGLSAAASTLLAARDMSGVAASAN